MSRWKVTGSLVKRWFILTAFGLILGNAYAVGGSSRPSWNIYLFNITLWTAMFMTFVRVNIREAQGWKKHLGTAFNLCGAAMMVMLGFVLVKWFDVPLNRYSSDIIIMILANLINSISDYPIVQKALTGINVAVAALLTSVIINFAKKTIKNVWNAIFMLISFLLIFALKVPSFIVILFGLATGIILTFIHKKKETKTDDIA